MLFFAACQPKAHTHFYTAVSAGLITGIYGNVPLDNKPSYICTTPRHLKSFVIKSCTWWIENWYRNESVHVVLKMVWYICAQSPCPAHCNMWPLSFLCFMQGNDECILLVPFRAAYSRCTEVQEPHCCRDKSGFFWCSRIPQANQV